MRKYCNNCKTNKEASEFHKSKNTKDELATQCKSCKKNYQIEYAKNNRNYISQRANDYYHKNREKIRNQIKLNRKENLTKSREKDKAHRLKYKDSKLETQRKYIKNNPDKKLEQTHKRRSLKKNAKGNFSAEEWKNLKQSYNNKCLRCLKKRKLTADHILPLSKNGSNYISNIQPLCKSCNSIKGIKYINYRKRFGYKNYKSLYLKINLIPTAK